jgi:hypothetical protein
VLPLAAIIPSGDRALPSKEERDAALLRASPCGEWRLVGRLMVAELSGGTHRVG